MYQRIFVPVDGGSASRRGLDEAIAVAKYTKGRLHLLHVVDDLPIVAEGVEAFAPSGPDIIDMVTDEGQKLLAEAQKSVHQAELTCDISMRRTSKGKVYEQIVQLASEWNADLIVIGTHGRTGAERLFMGSDAEQVVRHADVPVLLVRQKSEGD